MAVNNTPKASTSDCGMALILVLGIISVVTVMVAHLTSVVEIIAKEAKVQSEKEALRYKAESIAGETLWMYFTDRRLFSNRRLGQNLDTTGRADVDFEPWMMDRRPHLFNSLNGVSYLTAGDGGFTFKDQKSLKEDIDETDTELLEDTEIFLDVLNDYADKDDLVKLNGMESSEYDDEGFYTMPRNDSMQYRAEFYWLPNWQNIIQDPIAIVPPENKTLSDSSNSKPSIYACSDTEISQQFEELTDAELESIKNARNEWITNGTALDESLDSDLYAEIAQKFSFKEGFVAILYAIAYSSDKKIKVTQRETREVDYSRNSIFSDKKKETLSVWERFLE